MDLFYLTLVLLSLVKNIESIWEPYSFKNRHPREFCIKTSDFKRFDINCFVRFTIKAESDWKIIFKHRNCEKAKIQFNEEAEIITNSTEGSIEVNILNGRLERKCPACPKYLGRKNDVGGHFIPLTLDRVANVTINPIPSHCVVTITKGVIVSWVDPEPEVIIDNRFKIPKKRLTVLTIFSFLILLIFTICSFIIGWFMGKKFFEVNTKITKLPENNKIVPEIKPVVENKDKKSNQTNDKAEQQEVRKRRKPEQQEVKKRKKRKSNKDDNREERKKNQKVSNKVSKEDDQIPAGMETE